MQQILSLIPIMQESNSVFCIFIFMSENPTSVDKNKTFQESHGILKTKITISQSTISRNQHTKSKFDLQIPQGFTPNSSIAISKEAL